MTAKGVLTFAAGAVSEPLLNCRFITADAECKSSRPVALERVYRLSCSGSPRQRIPEKKKPRLLSTANGKGRTSEVYAPNISRPQQECKNGLNFLEKIGIHFGHGGQKAQPSIFTSSHLYHLLAKSL